METEAIVTFHGVEHSDAVERRIRREIQKLERFNRHITRCRVAVEGPDRHSRKGGLYRIRIEIDTPPDVVAVNRARPEDPAHEDVYVAIRDAFAAMRRRLEERTDVRRGDVKRHETPPHGVVTRLVPEADHGYIRMSDGGEVYFHRNAVIDGRFDRLKVGDEVRASISETESAKGPQATTVRPIGKHHITGP